MVDCYHAGNSTDVADAIQRHPRVRVFTEPTGWRWGRWYSNYNVIGFITGHLATLLAQWRLVRRLRRQHQAEPYDAVYQFVQTELFALRGFSRRHAPLVLHPAVHAAGELFWHRHERDLSRRCEPLWTRICARGMLIGRSAWQRRDISVARTVIAMSQHFADHLTRDYRVPPERIRVLPNPVDLQRFSPPSSPPPTDPVRLLLVSRLSVRKGVEMVGELSHRLDDLKGRVDILVLGDRTPWSDYTALLREFNPRTTTYLGRGSWQEMPELYRSVHGLLQPSRYEPFGLAVAEALASGVPVVCSDAVGAAELVDPACCRTFPNGDVAMFETTVRTLVASILAGDIGEVRSLARHEAERLFAPDLVARALAGQLRGIPAPETVMAGSTS
jgi:glycosyltransferase involved in cell wall biosynthesis